MMRRAPRYLMLALITSLALAAPGLAEDREFTPSSLKAMGGPNNPDVEIAWNRYYDSQEIGQICRRLAGTHPDLVRYGTIGKSVQGRDLHLLTITDWSAGDAAGKPAMYIDGNIHSNEIQGAEVALYTAWYVVENFDKVEWIRGLLERKTLYIVPSINPDARDYFIHEANTAHSPRSGMLPRDDDGDGEVDEDGFDDLDGDGNIVFMRKRERGGRWKEHGDDPRMMVEADPDEEGLYTMLGWEGYDNDGDGRVNEDGPGFYDPNRNWGWMWRPSHQQYGADQYPFSIPEDRAVADFVLAHPNIGGAQSYHNSGGMLLRGPGGKEDTESYKGDLPQYDFLGQLGEEMLPGYRYLVVHKDLYSVYGGELDWFHGARGIFTFSNELWSPFDFFKQEQPEEAGWWAELAMAFRFDQILLFGEGVVPWEKFDHPQYGEIEIGGLKKAWVRTAPSFMIEDMCHRNMAFTLFHAYHLPVVTVDSVRVETLSGSLRQVDVTLRNRRVLPSRSAHEVANGITPPDYVELRSAQVVAGFLVEDPHLDLAREQEHRPERLAVDAVAGMGAVHLRWIVDGPPPYEVVLNSRKAGIVTATIR